VWNWLHVLKNLDEAKLLCAMESSPYAQTCSKYGKTHAYVKIDVAANMKIELKGKTQ
jgi:hypothetical protein